MTEDGKSHKLQSSQEEKDLGLYIAENLKPGLQCAKAASKAMSVLGLIRRRFGKIDKESFRLPYLCSTAYGVFCASVVTIFG